MLLFPEYSLPPLPTERHVRGELAIEVVVAEEYVAPTSYQSYHSLLVPLSEAPTLSSHFGSSVKSHFQSSCFVLLLAASFVCGVLSAISICFVVFSFTVTLPH